MPAARRACPSARAHGAGRRRPDAAGDDRLEITGSNSSVEGDQITLQDSGDRVQINRTVGTSITPFSITVGQMELLSFNLLTKRNLFSVAF